MLALRLVLAYLAAFGMAAQVSSFRVRVSDRLTGMPIAGASVVLNYGTGAVVWGQSDAEGIFAGKASSAGSHLLTVTRNGYRMTGESMGKGVEIKAGSENAIAVQMRPLGVVAGRIVDQYGDPVRRAIVRTEDKGTMPGTDQFYQSYSTGMTNDLGEYRIADIEPGKHYIVAEYNTRDLERTLGKASRYRWPVSGGLVVYPDAIDPADGQTIEVAAGATTRLGDIRLKIQPPMTISGKIKLTASGKSVFLNLERRVKLALSTSPLVQGGRSEEDGSFRMEALPGDYFLTASDPKTGKMSKPVTVLARDKNISGVELELTSSYEVRGRVVIEGPESIDLSRLMLNFGGPMMKIDQNGAFQANLQGNMAMVHLQGLTGAWYLREMVVGGKRMTGGPFEIQPGITDMVFNLASDGARISVELNGAVGELPVVYVALLPETGPLPYLDSILHANADATGKFTLQAVPPGSYRIFTLNASNWALLFRPELLLEKYRKSAPLISVIAGERKQISIPIQNFRLE